MKAYLRVPYQDRFQAKGLGAHFDPQVKRWFALSRPEFMRCKRWWPDPLSDAIVAWLNDASLLREFGEVQQQVTISEQKRLLRDRARKTTIASSAKAQSRKDKAQGRHQRKHSYYDHLHTGKPVKTRARFAEPFSGSSTAIHSVTVKLPLLTQSE